MKFLFSISLFFLAIRLFAVEPLASGYPLAPRASASAEEKQRAYREIRNRVISTALRYENTPYRYGGITSAGLDCSGFIYLTFREAIGVSTPRSASALYSWAERVLLDSAQPGDLLFFKTDGTGRVTHVGLYLGNRRFIHSASIGPRTGVIINTLDEGNWMRNYVGAGRVFPEAAPGYLPDTAVNSNIRSASPSSASSQAATSSTSASARIRQPPASGSAGSAANKNSRVLAGFGFAPNLNVFSSDDRVVSGFTSQFRVGVETSSFGRQMIFGLELRPEYDGLLDVFHLPVTFSWGFNDKVRVFTGPIITTDDVNWLGTAGVTLAPFIINVANGELAPYAEFSWQANKRNNYFAEGLRFFAGIRWTINVNK